jgi:hypothetical protein
MGSMVVVMANVNFIGMKNLKKKYQIIIYLGDGVMTKKLFRLVC